MTTPVFTLAVAGAALALGCGRAAQTPPRAAPLSGTVVVVNQQSDSVTLIDLRAMEAYRHVPVVGGPHEAAASRRTAGPCSSPTTTSRAPGSRRR